MTKNKLTMELRANMLFNIEVDMEEFNEKMIKASDVCKEREAHILSKLPSNETIKEIFSDAENKIKELGYKSIQTDVSVESESPFSEFNRMMAKEIREKYLESETQEKLSEMCS